MKTKKINYLMMVLTLISGLIGWFAAEYIVVGLIYSNPDNTIPNTICMGIYFSIIAVFGCLGVILSEVIHPTYNLRLHNAKSSFPKRILISVLGVSIVLVMLFSMGFQYLYELTLGTSIGKKSIVFVMDCSGSLEYGSTANGIIYPPTDKDRQRITAAESIIDKLDASQFSALVSFTDEPSLDFEGAPMTEDNKLKLKQAVEKLDSNGENNIKGALDFTYENVIKSEGIKNPAVILFTDGEDNTLDTSNLDMDINNYIKDQIPIYSVEVNERLGDEGFAKSPLDKVAELTGGQYIAEKSADKIAGAFNSIYSSIQSTTNKDRVLIFKRSDPMNISQIWFFVVRVLCYMFIAALIGLAYTILLNNREAIITNLLSGLAAGIIMEVGYFLNGYPFMLRLITAAIIAAVICRYTPYNASVMQSEDFNSGFFTNDYQGFGEINDYNNEFNK